MLYEVSNTDGHIKIKVEGQSVKFMTVLAPEIAAEIYEALPTHVQRSFQCKLSVLWEKHETNKR